MRQHGLGSLLGGRLGSRSSSAPGGQVFVCAVRAVLLDARLATGPRFRACHLTSACCCRGPERGGPPPGYVGAGRRGPPQAPAAEARSVMRTRLQYCAGSAWCFCWRVVAGWAPRAAQPPVIMPAAPFWRGQLASGNDRLIQRWPWTAPALGFGVPLRWAPRAARHLRDTLLLRRLHNQRLLPPARWGSGCWC